MNVLFLTLGRMNDVRLSGIYTDLLRCFKEHGHDVYVVAMHEKKEGIGTTLKDQLGIHILQVKTGNIRECGMIEKGISTVRIQSQYKKAIIKYWRDIKFDLIMYSTPPITFANLVKYLKKRDDAHTYLILKDIFPQNSVDLGVMTKSGPKGLLYKYFRKIESDLYKISDRIGCMSPANKEYILRNNPYLSEKNIGICPNSIEVRDYSVTDSEKTEIRKKYNIPEDKVVCVYGGNLGKAQGIEYLVEALKTQTDNNNIYYLIIGDGGYYQNILNYIDEFHPSNVRLIKRLPKNEYDRIVAACDVGMLFLSPLFTIPNFPSRLLSYMQAKIPVLACTDESTDVGKIICDGGFGWWCNSADTNQFKITIDKLLHDDLSDMGERAFKYLVDNYDVEDAYNEIVVVNA